MIDRSLFRPEELSEEAAGELDELCRLGRGDVLRMTTLAGSGHPGGSMSSIEIFALLWTQANVDPSRPLMKDRDRIVVSHGHTSPGVYSILGRLGFFDLREAVVTFRKAGSPFEGHIERSVPGVEMTTGNLGQGISSACGMALADRVNGLGNHVWVVSGDGENEKGQVSEARRFAKKYRLGNLTVVVDLNGLQITGATDEVMPFDIAAEYEAAGWKVIEVDGHHLGQLYRALKPPRDTTTPRVVLARTVMGKGVSFMENDETYHGKALSRDQASQALSELGLEDDLDSLARERDDWTEFTPYEVPPTFELMKEPQRPRDYGADHLGDNRGAWGNALLDLCEANPDSLPLVFDCDLTGSVRTSTFARENSDHFVQCGIMEHHAASAAGGASLADVPVFWADFGVFAADETFNQHRLNDINLTNLKVIATHCGLDVGQDGKTHHCVQYLGLLANLRHYTAFVPADPNQTDRAVRYAAANPGNFFLAMGRAKTPVITREDGTPFFGGSYSFDPFTPNLLREGTDVVILTMGGMCHRALEVRTLLRSKGISTAVYSVHAPLDIPAGFAGELEGYDLVVSYEDHHSETGLGCRVSLAASSENVQLRLLRLGVTDYGLSGAPDDLYRLQGLTPNRAAAEIEEVLSS
ncbi:transketolase [Candidatus Fermentibacteria bacterium]|nr:transketolase [Candidatus Fermentibacteria bacterium]